MYSAMRRCAAPSITGPMELRGSSGGPILRLCTASTSRAKQAVVYFFEQNQPRRGGAFLPLIAESGIDNMSHRFVQIGVTIDDDGVFAAHLADDALHMRLPRPLRVSFPKDFQTHFARAGKGDQ